MCKKRRKSVEPCGGCPSEIELWANNVIPFAVANRCGFTYSKGEPVCANTSNAIELLKNLEVEDMMDALDRVEICCAEMLVVYREQRAQQ